MYVKTFVVTIALPADVEELTADELKNAMRANAGDLDLYGCAIEVKELEK